MVHQVHIVELRRSMLHLGVHFTVLLDKQLRLSLHCIYYDIRDVFCIIIALRSFKSLFGCIQF